MSLVVLFKTPEEDSEVDPYANALSACNLQPFYIPVLQHTGVNDEELRNIVIGGPQARYGGVIATSSRAAEMWVRAVEEVIERGPGQVDWRSTPFYVVGQKTSRVLSGDGRIAPDSIYKPTLLLGAQKSGTGAKLADFIISDYPTRVSATLRRGSETSSPSPSSLSSSSSWLPLLYLTGDKTTGTLLETLGSDSRIRTEQLQVYRTWPREEFEEDFARLRGHVETGTTQMQTSSVAANMWLVFFAPSAARAVLPTARRHFRIRQSSDHTSVAVTDAEQARLRDTSPEESRMDVRIAAIGPTTAAYLRTEAQLFVDFVPEKPNATELAHGIANV